MLPGHVGLIMDGNRRWARQMGLASPSLGHKYVRDHGAQGEDGFGAFQAPRGQRSALGITIGLAARAEVTLFDEPYAGLDAVARQAFYDRLLADFAAFPRTVLLSTHLIDEAAALFENVVVIDRGRVALDAAADGLRGMATTVSGPVLAVDSFTARNRRPDSLPERSKILHGDRQQGGKA